MVPGLKTSRPVGENRLSVVTLERGEGHAGGTRGVQWGTKD